MKKEITTIEKFAEKSGDIDYRIVFKGTATPRFAFVYKEEEIINPDSKVTIENGEIVSVDKKGVYDSYQKYHFRYEIEYYATPFGKQKMSWIPTFKEAKRRLDNFFDGAKDVKLNKVIEYLNEEGTVTKIKRHKLKF